MKKYLKYLTPCLFLVAGIGFSFVNKDISFKTAEASSYTVNTVPTTIDLNDTSVENIRSYYSSLNSKTTSERQGTNLLKLLKPILKNGQTYFSYGSSGTTAVWQAYEIVDRDWEKSPATSISGYNSSTNKITGYSYGTSNSNVGTNPYLHALYVNRDATNQTRAWGNHNQDQWGINQEHVWPKSCGFNDDSVGVGARGDLMHLWAGNGKVNGTYHSNYYYGYVDKTQSYDNAGTYASTLSNNLKGKSKTLGGTYTVFEPQDSDKGDIARAIFYMAARYNYLSGSDSDGIDAGNPNLEIVNLLNWAPGTSYTSNTTTKGQMGILQDLLEWNRLDPPDKWEIHRNNLLYNNFTHNRNPFIDFPEWAEFIWGKSENGSYNSSSTGYATPSTDTVNNFASSASTPTVNSVSISPTQLNLDLNGTKTGTLTATVSVSNGAAQTVTWSTSNSSVATVSNGVVTGKAVGSATITATSTVDSTKKATCSVTVTNSSGSGLSSDYSLFSGSLTEGNYVIYYNGKAMKNTVSNDRLSYQEVTPSNDVISNPDDSIVWHIAPSDNYWTIYNSSTGKYAASTGVANKAQLLTSGTDDQALWTVSGTSTYEFVNKCNSSNSVNSNLRNNGTYGFACYSTSTGGKLSLYKQEASSVPVLSSITLDLSNVKTSFDVGEAFDYTGLVVTANYEGGSSSAVEPTSVSAPDMTSFGEKTVTVTYTENEVSKTATYSITVSQPVVNTHGIVPEDPLSVSEAIDICMTIGNETSDDDYYTLGIVSQVTYFSSTYGSITFYISSDGTTTNQLQVYGCKNVNGASFSAKGDLTVGTKVIVVGKLIYYNSTTPEYNTNCKIYQYVTEPSNNVSLTQTFSENGYSNGAEPGTITFYNKNNQSIEAVFGAGTNANNSPKYYDTGTSIRCYQNNTLTITSSKNNLIRISFTLGDTVSAVPTVNVGNFSDGVWTGTSNQVVFTMASSGQYYIQAITVTYFSAVDFATYFIDNINCNVNGTSEPTGNWTTFTNKYNDLFIEDQNTLKNATYTKSGSGSSTVVTPGTDVNQTVANCVARYDLIIAKYGITKYPNFISRTVLSSHSSLAINKNDSSIGIIVFTMSSVSILTLTLFLIKRKRTY